MRFLQEFSGWGSHWDLSTLQLQIADCSKTRRLKESLIICGFVPIILRDPIFFVLNSQSLNALALACSLANEGLQARCLHPDWDENKSVGLPRNCRSYITSLFWYLAFLPLNNSISFICSLIHPPILPFSFAIRIAPGTSFDNQPRDKIAMILSCANCNHLPWLGGVGGQNFPAGIPIPFSATKARVCFPLSLSHPQKWERGFAQSAGPFSGLFQPKTATRLTTKHSRDTRLLIHLSFQAKERARGELVWRKRDLGFQTFFHVCTHLFLTDSASAVLALIKQLIKQLEIELEYTRHCRVFTGIQWNNQKSREENTREAVSHDPDTLWQQIDTAAAPSATRWQGW